MENQPKRSRSSSPHSPQSPRDVQNLQIDSDDSEGQDLFGPELDRDYRENVNLDRYDDESDDQLNFDPMDQETRLVAEAHMRSRDRRMGKPVAFVDNDLPDLPQRRSRFRDEFADFDQNDDQVNPLDLDALRDPKGPLAQFVMMEAPLKTIKLEFHRFLTGYIDAAGLSVYGERIKLMCQNESCSLEIDYPHLFQANATLTYYLVNSPVEMLDVFDQVAMQVVLAAFENYDSIHTEIHCRIAGLPVSESLRDLRQTNLNTLVRVSGVVTRRSGVFPQLKYVKYDCLRCGALLGPFYQDSIKEIKLNRCSSCQAPGPFQINSEQTLYRNYQRLTLQETPGSVLAGRLPRSRDVICLWDLVDCARPGEQIDLTGIYKNTFDIGLNTRNGFPVFSTLIQANHIAKRTRAATATTEQDIAEIRQLATDPQIRQRIIRSIAPSIYGHEDIKTALALAMFGGVFKNPQGKHRLRGDINVLLLGDPGTAKSQFLKYVEKTSQRAVFTTGQGASAVGLTAAVHKDTVTREWTLEGGALVMADKGVCLIDEFDKMNDKDRTSIHEAMEQQSISISKAGIVATLHARCAVIAAANPISGRYNAQLAFSQNVELTEPILSRFDVLCVVRDTADPIVDSLLAKFVVDSHMRSHPNAAPQALEEVDSTLISQDLLIKYIAYARDHVFPTMAGIDVDKLERLYSELRRESMIGGGIPITVRYLESIIRMAEAFARMSLRDHVRQDDIDMAISVTVGSFISAQKHSVKKTLSKVFDKYLVNPDDAFGLLMHALANLYKEHMRFDYYQSGGYGQQVEIDVEEYMLKVRELGVYDTRAFLDSRVFAERFTLDSKRGKIRAI